MLNTNGRWGRSLEDICGGSAVSTRVELRGLLDEVAKFLQHDALAKNIKIVIAGDETVVVSARRSNLRLIILSLVTQGLDQAAPGSTITLRATASPPLTLEITGVCTDEQAATVRLLLPVTQRLMALDGGVIEPHTGSLAGSGWTLRW